MIFLGGLSVGKRITVAGDGVLVVATSEAAPRGVEILEEELAELERRGWISFDGQHDAVITAEGRKWFRIWYEQSTGRKLN